MQALEDLSAGFGGADCYFTVSKPIGDQVEALAATCTVQLPRPLIKKDSDGAIAVHAKSLAALLKLTKQPPVASTSPPVVTAPAPTPPAPTPPAQESQTGGAKKPTTPPAVVPPTPPAQESQTGGAKKPTTPPAVVPPTPPAQESNEPGSATSDDSAAI